MEMFLSPSGGRMPTVIGLIFALLGMFCLAKRREWLLGLLVLSGIFEASSVINFGSKGVQPYYLIACIFIYSQLMKRSSQKDRREFLGRKLLFAFVCIGVLSALVYPIIFEGIPVYAQGITIDEGYFYRLPLHFSAGSNAIQAGCLVINALVVTLAAATARTDGTRIFYNLAFGILIGVIFLQFAAPLVGMKFPTSMFRNNSGYEMSDESGLDISERTSGTYTEPSGAGATLVIFYAECLYEFICIARPSFKIIVAILAVGIVRSSSSLVAVLLITVAIPIFYPPFRAFFFIRKRRLAKLVSLVAVAMVFIFSPLSGIFKQYIFQKNETLSYVHRLAADAFSLKLTLDTFGVGVGLGSNRPSSLATSLLSNVGIVGTVIFVFLIIQIARNAKGSDTWLRWSLFGYIVCKCLGNPDINEPMLWILLALIANCSNAPQNNGKPAELIGYSSSDSAQSRALATST